MKDWAVSLASGYGFSYRVAVGIVLVSIVLVATQLSHRACQAELARQFQEVPQAGATLTPEKGEARNNRS